MCLHKKQQGGEKILTQIQTWPRDLPAISSGPRYSLNQFPYQRNRVILALWLLWDLEELIKKGSWHTGAPALQGAPGPSSLDMVLGEVLPSMTGKEAELLKDQVFPGPPQPLKACHDPSTTWNTGMTFFLIPGCSQPSGDDGKMASGRIKGQRRGRDEREASGYEGKNHWKWRRRQSGTLCGEVSSMLGKGACPCGQESAQCKGGWMARGLVQGWGEGKKRDIQIYSLQPPHTSWGFHTLVFYKFINEKVDIC